MDGLVGCETGSESLWLFTMAIRHFLLLLVLLAMNVHGFNLPAGNTRVPQVLKGLFKLLFPNSSSLCYIFQNDSVHVVQLLSLPVTLLEYHNKAILQAPNCDDYVVSINDLSSFKQFLLRRSTASEVLKPHRRVVVLYEGAARVHLHELLGLYAMDVVELEMPGNSMRLKRLSEDRVIFQWNLDEEEFFMDEAAFGEHQWNPQEFSRNSNYTIRFAVFGCEPFIFADKEGRVLGGPEISLAREMARGLPMRFVFVGKATENPWVRALRLVKQGLSDMAGCSQYIANQWQQNIEFTINQNQICQTFLVPKPHPPRAVYFLVQCFSWQVWLCLTLGVILFGLFGRLAMRRASYVMPVLDVVRLYSSGSVFVAPGALQSFRARIFFIFLLWHSFLMSTYYSAGLSSTLTVPRFIRQINTLQDVVDYGITFQEQSGIVESFQLINSSLFLGLARLHRDRPRSSTPLDGYTAMTVKTLENSYVTDLEGFEQEKLDGYKALKECIGNHYMGFALQVNSPFKRRFDTVASRIMESGLMRKWLHEQIYQKSGLQEQFFSSYAYNAQYETITAGRLYGGFVMLFAGFASGALVFLFEVGHYWCKAAPKERVLCN